MNNPTLKSILRKPIKIILLLLILLYLSNAFVLNLITYMVANGEIEKAKKDFKSIGYIHSLDPDNFNVFNAREIIRHDDMILYEDINNMNMGIIDNLHNADYASEYRYYNYGDLKYFGRDRIFIAEIITSDPIPLLEDDSKYDNIAIRALVIDLIAGYPDGIYGEINPDNRVLIAVQRYESETGKLIPYIDDEVIDDVMSMKVGERFLFRGSPFTNSGYEYLMVPLYEGGPLFEKIDNVDGFSLDDSKWSKLKEDIEVININNRSLDIRTTVDMSTMPITQESLKTYYLREGRWIDYEDNEKKNPVCVISKEFKDRRGIGIGDKLSIKMVSPEGGTHLLTKRDRTDWRTYSISESIEYEVVGVFDLNETYLRGRLSREIYIPISTLPSEIIPLHEKPDNQYISDDRYSFVLKNPEDQSEIIDKYKSELGNMGFKLQFIENNAESFWNSSNKVIENLKTNLIIYGVLLLFSQIFIVYFYIEQYKNNYAIERALGLPFNTSILHLLSPLIIFGSFVIILGSYLGYRNSMLKSKEILTDIMSELTTDLSLGLSIEYLIIIISVIICSLALVSILRVRKLRRESIIDLIKNSNKNKITVEEDFPEVIKPIGIKTIAMSNLSDRRIKKGYRSTKGFFRNYMFKHISRSMINTLLLLLVTIILVSSLLWINNLIVTNKAFIDKSLNETVVHGSIGLKPGVQHNSGFGYIPESKLEELLRTGLVKDYFVMSAFDYDTLNIKREDEVREINRADYLTGKYYEANPPAMNVISTNKEYNSGEWIYLSGLNIEDMKILEEFTSAYDVGDITNHEKIPVLASIKGMEEYDLKIGDEIYFKSDYRETLDTYASIVGTFEYYNLSHGVTQVTGGAKELFLYPINALRVIEEQGLMFNRVDLTFDSHENKELLERREELNTIVGFNKDGRKTDLELKIFDETLNETIEPLEKNLNLLNILYPIIFAISIVVATILPYLMIIKRSEELTVMRMLGVNGKEIKRLVLGENMLLITIGIVLATIVVLIMTVSSSIVPIIRYTVAIGGYLAASIIGLIMGVSNILNQKPLDMLQTKD